MDNILIRPILIALIFCFSVLSNAQAEVQFNSATPPLAIFNSNLDPIQTNNQFVPVDQAFPFNFYQQGDTVYLDWQIKPGYYLYQERFSFTGQGAEIDEFNIPDGEAHRDEFFGDVHIYTQPITVAVKLLSTSNDAELIVQYQGCATSGFCYPPETRSVPLSRIDNHIEAPTATKPAITNSSIRDSAPPSDSQDASFAAQLAQHWWTPVLFLLLGIGLAFTPCVLPMYPILTGIVLGGGKQSAAQAFKLSFVYVQGMALTYALLGLVVASLGVQFQASLQHPYVLSGLSALFVLLALSMFGFYNLQLPSKVQTWLNQQSNKQQSGNLVGVFIMGIISGLICSPCTTAPLSGALLYVAQSQELFTGGIALYALAIGMGIPLILVAMFGNKLLPQAGEWMNKIKVLFGFILLAAPLFLLERILPELWSNLLWSGLGFITFSWLYHAKNSVQAGSWRQSLLAIIAILGLMSSLLLTLQTSGIINTTTQQASTKVKFIRVNNMTELEQQLSLAQQAGKPVMFDFYADWCVACKEFEKYTFHAPLVANKLSQFVLLQADVTKGLPQDIELMQTMQVLGLPTIEFWQANGQHLPAARISGFMKVNDFVIHLNKNGL